MELLAQGARVMKSSRSPATLELLFTKTLRSESLARVVPFNLLASEHTVIFR